MLSHCVHLLRYNINFYCVNIMIDIIISMFLSSLMSVFIPLWVVQTNNNIKNNNNDYVMMYFMKL